MRIAFDWDVSPFFGWGVYGMNLAVEWSKCDGVVGSTTAEVSRLLSPLVKKALRPFIVRSGRPAPDALILHHVGNWFLPEREHGGVAISFFDQPLSDAAVERARRYPLIVAGSTWNMHVLKEAMLQNVVMIPQGVDHSLFHPAPRAGLYPGKFLIFSGGKAEFRKGQDIVVQAFRAFAGRHKEVMLVTAWHSFWKERSLGLDLDLSGYMDRVIDVDGIVPNDMMPAIYRECDVALFPNRAEGGTNLVAMECIACGVPTILSANTGHMDLIEEHGVIPLRRQRPVEGGWSEWGESDVDEILGVLEQEFDRWRVGCQHRSQYHLCLREMSWERTSDELLEAVGLVKVPA